MCQWERYFILPNCFNAHRDIKFCLNFFFQVFQVKRGNSIITIPFKFWIFRVQNENYQVQMGIIKIKMEIIKIIMEIIKFKMGFIKF